MKYCTIIIIILIIIILLLYLQIKYDSIPIAIDDHIYIINRFTSNIINTKTYSNKLITPINKKNKILIITLETRKDEPYVIEHNKNISAYADKYGFDYKFISECSKNIYWCKIFVVREALETSKYDYVMWLDSDTLILDFNYDLNNILNSNSSDLFFVDDNISFTNTINAGVYIIKNSIIGKSYLDDCLKKYNTSCINSITKKLKGIWAGTCYEQGQMNLIAENSYLDNLTIFSKEICICTDKIKKLKTKHFIFHYYATSVPLRNYIFTYINNSIGIK